MSVSDEKHYVYAVSSGDYSDYSVHCIFEREEDARAHLEAQGLVEVVGTNYWDKGEKVWTRPTVAYAREQFIETFQFWPAGTWPIQPTVEP